MEENCQFWLFFGSCSCRQLNHTQEDSPRNEMRPSWIACSPLYSNQSLRHSFIYTISKYRSIKAHEFEFSGPTSNVFICHHTPPSAAPSMRTPLRSCLSNDKNWQPLNLGSANKPSIICLNSLIISKSSCSPPPSKNWTLVLYLRRVPSKSIVQWAVWYRCQASQSSWNNVVKVKSAKVWS